MALTDKQIVAKLRRKGGKTAKELGTDVTRMKKIAQAGEFPVEPSGVRHTKQRGRPATEWSLVEAA